MSSEQSTTTIPTVGNCIHCGGAAQGEGWEKNFRVPSMKEIEDFLQAQGQPRVVHEEHLLMVLVCSVCRSDLEMAGMTFHKICSARKLIEEDERRRAEKAERDAAELAVRKATEAQAKVKRDRALATAALFGHKPSEQRQRTEVVGRIEPTTRRVELPRQIRGAGEFRHAPFADLGKKSGNEQRVHAKGGRSRNRGS